MSAVATQLRRLKLALPGLGANIGPGQSALRKAIRAAGKCGCCGTTAAPSVTPTPPPPVIP